MLRQVPWESLPSLCDQARHSGAGGEGKQLDRVSLEVRGRLFSLPDG